jgi:hypothetical protein
MQSTHRCGKVLARAALCGLASALPGQIDRTEWVCIERIDVPPERSDSRMPIVPGCEVIDCCPGCPGAGVVEWSIDVRGLDLGAIELRLEGFAADELMNLRTSDGIGRDEPERLLVPTGMLDARIQGMPLRRGGRLPVVWPSLLLDRQRTTRYLMSRGDAGEQQAAGEIELLVRQHLLDGRTSFLIRHHRVIFRFVSCGPGGGSGDDDIVRLLENTDGDDAVVLLDGARVGSCEDDGIWRGGSDIAVGAVKASTVCNAEVAVFSDNNAMALQPAGWTNGADLVQVVLQPAIVVPVKVWLMVATIGGLPAIDVAKVHLAKAEQLYNQNHAGVAFSASYTDLSANAAAVAMIGTDDDSLDDSGWVNALVLSAHFTPNMLNVYYVQYTDTGANGRNSILNRNIVMIAALINDTTLAHEFGHAFSLEHMNSLGNAHYSNVMYTGSDFRTVFTEGQCFRVNVAPASILNTNLHRMGPTRSCPHGASDPLCPGVALDATPN